MEEENRKPKALTKKEEREEVKKMEEKKQRIFKTKDLVFTAIIAFLIGAIVVAAGFAICGKNNRRDDFRNFKQDGVQREFGPGEFNNNKGQNNDNMQNNNGTMQRPDMNNGQQNEPSIPNNNSNSQNAPTAPNGNGQSNSKIDSNPQSNG